ncbi:MAG TPA: acyl-CoA synthetase, partial [Bacteroidia bacterium]|nr:acyl-CoA synthetase [Bacteroidia bacterium]
APPGLPYVAGMLGGMMSGAMMVPLCVDHPKAELEHVIADSNAKIVLVHPILFHLLEEINCAKKKLLADVPPKEPVAYNWDYPKPSDNALMLYTSGTTGKPKGVVHTHASLAAQISCLTEAWEWTEEDSILHFLPLHHTHGIINKLFCALWSGAHCEMLGKFDPKIVWEKIASGKYSLFMAVPTVYSKMISAWEEGDEATKEKYSEACSRFRLMVSGSAALPVSVLEKWKSISGHVLLERYGMTETGMVLSNSLHGERKAGFVGKPLPGMEVRIADSAKEDLEIMGELEVRGKNIFKEYWKKPQETKKSFTEDGWFRTGDMVAVVDGNYKIVGRLSTDIIKSGGYKISALEIEAVLLQHPVVNECCVLGLPDEIYGEKIAAILVLKQDQQLTLEEIREWAKDKLANYKLPSLLKIQDSLPRNAMGKVVKNEAKNFF